jgi:hypothetical protein
VHIIDSESMARLEGRTITVLTAHGMSHEDAHNAVAHIYSSGHYGETVGEALSGYLRNAGQGEASDALLLAHEIDPAAPRLSSMADAARKLNRVCEDAKRVMDSETDHPSYCTIPNRDFHGIEKARKGLMYALRVYGLI